MLGTEEGPMNLSFAPRSGAIRPKILKILHESYTSLVALDLTGQDQGKILHGGNLCLHLLGPLT